VTNEERRPGGLPRRIALLLEYDGSRYSGSQYQKNAPSIQAELEAAFNKLTGETLRAAFASRTDAGVHARGQVASFVTCVSHALEAFVGGLNHWLPSDIAVRRAVEVPTGFDVRRHARSREYRYAIHRSPVRSPLLQPFAWQVAESLDVEAMERAAAGLVGRYDFAAFTGGGADVRGSTLRRVHRCELSARGPLLVLLMEANAFLPHQVRRTVGALVQVGTGRLDVERFTALVREAVPDTLGPAAPAQGLCLMRVNYPGLDLGERCDEDIYP
jgi:tRNA pseudouridine38-40 synthase